MHIDWARDKSFKKVPDNGYWFYFATHFLGLNPFSLFLKNDSFCAPELIDSLFKQTFRNENT